MENALPSIGQKQVHRNYVEARGKSGRYAKLHGSLRLAVQQNSQLGEYSLRDGSGARHQGRKAIIRCSCEHSVPKKCMQTLKYYFLVLEVVVKRASAGAYQIG